VGTYIVVLVAVRNETVIIVVEIAIAQNARELNKLFGSRTG
jgi:hypothetical protein